MNFFEDAFRYFTNLDKEASAKHILLTGPNASKELEIVKQNIMANVTANNTDLLTAFSDQAMLVSRCPSSKRGGNLGTFKPGMLVREIDRVCFEKEIGVIHGPVETQFGSHLILVTRRVDDKGTS